MKPEDILYIAVPSFGMFHCMTAWPRGTSVFALPSLHTTPCIAVSLGDLKIQVHISLISDLSSLQVRWEGAVENIFDLMSCSRSFMLEEPLLCVAPCT